MRISTNEYGLFIASSRRDANRPSRFQFPPPPPSFSASMGEFSGFQNPCSTRRTGGFPQPRRSQFQGRFRWCCSVANRQRPDRLQFRGPAGPQFWVGIESSRSRSASSEEPGNGRQNRCPPPRSPFSGRVAFLVARFQKQSTHVGSGSATFVIFLVQCIAFLLFTIIFCVEIDVVWNPTLSS